MFEDGRGEIEILTGYSTEMKAELARILSYWDSIVTDHEEGGFYGKIGHDNKIVAQAPKGSVLNSRILWAFSAAYNLTREPRYLAAAERAYEYILNHCIDREFGGVYWTVDHSGKPLDSKKQTYATAFAIYGLAEFYKSSNNEEVKQKAIGLYRNLLQHTLDLTYGGYFEAFARNWDQVADARLSAKDANEKKSMNTHLHVIEGFANLYSIWPDEDLKNRIRDLLKIFLDHIINRKDNHLHLFFEEDWSVKSSLISYGHDIEAGWLLLEAAEIIKDEDYIKLYRSHALTLTAAAAEGLDKDGGLWYEYEPANNHYHREKHWWPQAEAMVGFFNSWQLTGNRSELLHSLNAWSFVKDHILDVSTGEWVWGVYDDYKIMNKEDKAGLWKCPYHNSRACIEIISRIDRLKLT
jgi:mannobiose 2-epimerase